MNELNVPDARELAAADQRERQALVLAGEEVRADAIPLLVAGRQHPVAPALVARFGPLRPEVAAHSFIIRS